MAAAGTPPEERAAAMPQSATDDLRIRTITPLATPAEVMDECPATPAALATVGNARTALHRILAGSDDRLEIVMRVYFEKPRTIVAGRA